MKKILAVLLMAIALPSLAKETITIVYSWSLADQVVNTYRRMADEANQSQDKYYFVIESKPGAGGSIAANYVQATPNTILANSSAFFIRPNFFPNESHDISKFKGMIPVCKSPFIISSKKYKSWSEVPADAKLTIGTSGNGTTTHLVAAQIAKKYPNMIIVPFKSTTEALVSALGGNIDFAVNFVGESAQYVNNEKNRVYVLGATGKHNLKVAPNLIDQGFPIELEKMDTPQQFMIPANFPEQKFKEIHAILSKSGKTKSFAESIAPDHCENLTGISESEVQPYYHFQTVFWKKLTSTVTIKQ
jgi:tripartite-type tricarboxylate transporter receptor subunit TctC